MWWNLHKRRTQATNILPCTMCHTTGTILPPLLIAMPNVNLTVTRRSIEEIATDNKENSHWSPAIAVIITTILNAIATPGTPPPTRPHEVVAVRGGTSEVLLLRLTIIIMWSTIEGRSASRRMCTTAVAQRRVIAPTLVPHPRHYHPHHLQQQQVRRIPLPTNRQQTPIEDILPLLLHHHHQHVVRLSVLLLLLLRVLTTS